VRIGAGGAGSTDVPTATQLGKESLPDSRLHAGVFLESHAYKSSAWSRQSVPRLLLRDLGGYADVVQDRSMYVTQRWTARGSLVGRAHCRLNHCRLGGMRGARAGALAVRIPKLNFVLVLYPSPTHSVWRAGGRSNVCITTQYCSVFSRNPRSCSGVALGAATSK
jgi:hypothetical protein